MTCSASSISTSTVSRVVDSNGAAVVVSNLGPAVVKVPLIRIGLLVGGIVVVVKSCTSPRSLFPS